MKIWTWLKSHFKKQNVNKETPWMELKPWTDEDVRKYQESQTPKPHVTKPRTLADIRAVRKMKHGHQASWYRKSVKANVKPDEEDN